MIPGSELTCLEGLTVFVSSAALFVLRKPKGLNRRVKTGGYKQEGLHRRF
jgi:hypothetical protein